MNDIIDKRVEEMSEIVDNYLNCLDSIKDTFINNYNLLKRLESKTIQSFKNFVKNNKIKENDEVSSLEMKRLKSYIKKVEKASLALIIFPQSMLVSMVSQYDYLIGQLIQFIYNVTPNLLNDSNSQISYKEIFAFNDLTAIKNKIIQDKIETTLRKSHEEQIDDLQKLSGVKNLKGVSFWKEFIEITQRRNLFVHCKGRVSDQYIKECERVGVVSLPSKDEELFVDEIYFDKAYSVFYKMGVLLSQVIIRHMLDNKTLGEIDTILTHIIYELIEEEKYDLAIELSKFALEKSTKHACRLDEVYFVLNYAQACKWQGNQQKCDEILSAFDFSAMTPDILVAKYALEDDIAHVVECMNKIGDNSKIMNKDAYASWPIFKEMREKVEFRNAYKNVFKEDMNFEILTPEENKMVEEIENSITD